MPLTASAIIAGVGGLGKAVNGISQIIGGKKKARNNKRPIFDIQPEYFENEDLAAFNAESGLSDPTLDYYSGMADRGLSTGAGATMAVGGSANDLAKLYDVYNQGNLRTAAEDAQLKTQHLQTLLQAKKELAGQKTQKWALDKYEPYKDTAKAASDEISAGQKNFFGGLGELGGSLAAYDQSNNFDNFSATTGGGTPRSSSPVLTASMPAFNPSFELSDDNPFATQGGGDFLNSIYKQGPDSAELDRLIRQMQTTQNQ